MKKDYIKKNIIGFVVGVILCMGSLVYAAVTFPSSEVSYDNKESGLSSTTVKGAIDELYKTCTAEKVDVGGKDVIIVDEGDGLYEDEYEDGRYFYKGGNPNNYVTFNNEQAGWRIISIEPDRTIKIMKTSDINTNNNLAWDTSGSLGNNNWARPATLNTYLNGTYYNNLNSTAQSQIEPKDWSIGAVTYDDSNMANQINNENGTKWNGKVALATVSEYIRSNSNKSICGSFSLNNDYYSSCKYTTWMFDSSDYWCWTLSPYSVNSNNVFYVGTDGRVISDIAFNSFYEVHPALYLSSEVKIAGGNGTQNNPYILG